jgi:hypothetical protein
VSERDLDIFIARWKGKQGAERANYAIFLSELCSALDLPPPEPANPDTEGNAYVFERAVKFLGEGKTGRIDLYKKGCFVLEAKQYHETADQAEFALSDEPAAKKSGAVRGTAQWDDAMLKARGQAERYARALPREEDPPPFLIVCDVGHVFELYADFSQKGKAYLAFPDSTSHRIKLDDLTQDEIRERLRAVWTNPTALDPAKRSAEVTREVAAHLAELAKSFEKSGHEPKVVADFLARCLFCMFAEDVGLLPADSFTRLLDELKGDPGGFVPLVEALFREMNSGAYSTVLRQKLLRFNGGLFEDCTVLKVNGTQLGLLRRAAKLKWRDVEPSIFGTLLERALNPDERHKLGAHYTPRAYVERLVLPTIIEPLREEWAHARAAAVTHARAGRMKEAIAEARAFHDRLCHVRVLDPACGSGNFLYVTLELMKRLEGEVLDQFQELGDRQVLLDLATVTVDPHQFLGLEINPRAAAVTDLVLWIGYLQWHFRTRGKTLPAEPVLKKFANIQCADAVLAYDQEEPVTWLLAAEHPDLPGLPDTVRDEIKKRADEIRAKPEKFRHKMVDVWDRRSVKPDPVTGREVPDESKRTTLRRYTNPRPAPWPATDYIVGNPPFLGTSRMREDLGDGYAQTLRKTYPDVPESADFVMYWWHKAAQLVREGQARRFGLITTNSLRQTFNRRVVQNQLSQSLTLAFAIPDHPWVDTADGAAVRIAMTVGTTGLPAGDLYTVTAETPDNEGASEVKLDHQRGSIQADLTVGAAVAEAQPLQANDLLTYRGVQVIGSGFILTSEQASDLGYGKTKKSAEVIYPYLNGRDLMDSPRNALVIDFFGLSEVEAREKHPKIYQHVLATVKPERDQNKRDGYRKNWWIFGEPRRELRNSLQGLPRYIATVETAKHRVFQFLDASIRPDNKLVVISLDNAFHLGVLSGRIHTCWALAQGAILEDRPVYPKTECFDPFPFPVCSEKLKERIRGLAEELDAHRKRAQAKHGVGLTDMYNVLEKVRAGEGLTDKEKALHERALIGTLKQLHDDLDAAVAEAYGWPWPMSEPEILERVVALNKERAAEEARGLVRWLRPDYQKPAGKAQGSLDLGEVRNPKSEVGKKKKVKQPWPKKLAEQVRAVESVLTTEGPLPAEKIAKHFLRAPVATIQEILDTLRTLGRA